MGSSDIEKASERFLDFVLMPAWIVAGYADYLIHRKANIERTSGTHESLTHILMISSAGVGVAARMFFEVNETVLAVMTASALTHEAIVLWDIAYASNVRPPSATEQHVHSFLEVLPWAGLAFTMCIEPKVTASFFRTGMETAWKLEPKKHPAAPLYNVCALTIAALFQVIPYTEEFLRCWSNDHTLLPHKRPIES